MKIDSRVIPTNQLWYYVTDDAILDNISLYQKPFDTQVVKHEKQINKCIITCVDDIRVINEVWYGGKDYITNIVIPDSVTEIGNYAMYECDSLTSVTIGKSVTYIGSHAFFYCRNLKDVYCKPIIPPEFGANVFGNNGKNRKIYVPRNSVESYKKEWNKYASDIEPYDF